MLDIKFIRENLAQVKKDAANKGYKTDVDAVLELDNQRKKLTYKIDELRARRNQISDLMKKAGGKPSEENIIEGKKIKTELAELESEFRDIDEKLNAGLNAIPNILQPDVPIGEEGEDKVVREWGIDLAEQKFGSERVGAKDHLDFATNKNWVDFERGAKVAGAKFYFLKGDLALLENAIYQFALNKLIAKGFNFMTVPHMVNSEVATGTGFAPRSSEQSDEYFIEGEDLSLIATAEDMTNPRLSIPTILVIPLSL